MQNKDEIKITKNFDYQLRSVSLKFSLVSLLEMKDFRVLLKKGLEDLDEEIKKQEDVLHSTHEFTRVTTTKEAEIRTEDNPDDIGLVPEQP